MNATQAMPKGSRSLLWSLPLAVWQHRELLLHLISRNLRVQYKQSVLGYAWIILNPLAQLLTLAFVFSVVFPSQSQQDAPFTLFLFVGLLPWIFFSNAVSAATDSISGGASMVTAVYFPRELLVVSAVLVRFVDLIAGAIILAVLLILAGQPLGWAALWLPVLLLLQFAFVIGLSLPLAALNLFFHDIRYLVGVLLYLWFFFTPIFYARSIVPARYDIVYDLNPIARLIDSYRYALLQDVGPPWGSVAAVVGLCLLTLAIGYALFKKMEPAFADSI